MEKDPDEMNNLYGEPQYAPIIAKMKKQLEETRVALKETDEKHPEIQKVIEEHWCE